MWARYMQVAERTASRGRGDGERGGGGGREKRKRNGKRDKLSLGLICNHVVRPLPHHANQSVFTTAVHPNRAEPHAPATRRSAA